MRMTLSKRKIREEFRKYLPAGAHIRKGVDDAVDEIITKTLTNLILMTLMEADTNTVTEKMVWAAYGKIQVGRDNNFTC